MAAVTGCDARAGTTTAGAATSAAVVDSALAPEEALRRFRATLPPTAELSGAETTRDALVRRFVAAIEASDTAALRAMVLNRAEYAYLYYESSPHARPPMRQAPDLAWFLHVQNSQKGVSRVLQRFSGTALAVRGYRCEAPRVAGDNVVWDDCRLRVTTRAGIAEHRMFGGIIERGGRYKLFSYANDF